MSRRRIQQSITGMLVGVGAQLLLPGHPTMHFMTAVLVCLAGAVTADLLAERLLPRDEIGVGGFVIAALGALGGLLAMGLVS